MKDEEEKKGVKTSRRCLKDAKDGMEKLRHAQGKTEDEDQVLEIRRRLTKH